jgi:8-oxo-dGTP diphosphatase
MSVRNSVKAILISENKILLTKNKDDEGYFYLCPGGGQEHGETFHDTLKRECIEEIGQQVEVGELLYIREYIGKNHEHSSFDFNFHQVEYYFSCTPKVTNDSYVQPTNPDSHQVGIEWIDIDDILQYRFYPKELRKYIIKHFNGEKTSIYLGDIN